MNNIRSTSHLLTKYDQEIGRIKDKVLSMGGIVEKVIVETANALSERNNTLLPDTNKSEEEINAYEVEIDKNCVEILARRQPVAFDLRMIVAIMKITANLERMGDESEKLIKLAKKSSFDLFPSALCDVINDMSRHVIKAISQAMDCFSRIDSDQAKRLVLSDKEIDNQCNEALRLLLIYAMENPQHMVNVLNTMWCVRALERIGDHSKNIAEHTIYIDKAVDVRHQE